MLELPNFGHMTTSTIQFESCDVMLRNYDVDKIYFKIPLS